MYSPHACLACVSDRAVLRAVAYAGKRSLHWHVRLRRCTWHDRRRRLFRHGFGGTASLYGVGVPVLLIA